MAKEDIENGSQDTPNKGPGKFGIAIIVVMLFVIMLGLIQDDEGDKTATRNEEGFDPEQAAIEEAEQREQREKLAAQQRGSSTDDGTLDPFAAMSAMTRRQEMLEQKLDEVTGELEEAQDSAEEFDKLEERSKRLEDQLRQLTQMLMDEGEESRLRDRQEAASLNEGGDDLAFDLEGGLSESELEDADGESQTDFRIDAPKPRSPYGENYIVLNNGTRNPVLSNSNPFAGGSSGPSPSNGDGLFTSPEDGLDAPNPFSDEESSGTTQTPAPRPAVSSAQTAGMTPEYSDVQAGYVGAARREAQAVQQEKEEADTTINVPAFSFVEAKTLHGLDCPIGAEMPRSTEGNAAGVTPGRTQPMPVVLPLKGKIRGPNGHVVDLGTAHVMGWCIGRRVDRGESGRAMIKVESISYWDRKGDPQYLNSISGDVISLIDNHRGIQAPVDEVRRSYLGEQAGAAALAAAATQVNQAQFEETRNPNSGVDRVFTGNQGLAVGAQSGSAAFSTIAELINEEAREAFDTVRVPSGAPVRVMFMTPFEVTNTKLEVEDEILDAYDVLI